MQQNREYMQAINRHTICKIACSEKKRRESTECTGEIEMIEDILLILHIAFLCERS